MNSYFDTHDMRIVKDEVYQDEVMELAEDIKRYITSLLWVELNPILEYIWNQVMCYAYGKPLNVCVIGTSEVLHDIDSVRLYVTELLNS